MTPIENVVQDEEVFFAQVDSYVERKDYQRNGRCVRFTAVRARDLADSGFDAGLTTFTVDLSYWQFCHMIAGRRWVTKSVQEDVNSGVFSGGQKEAWYQLKVRWNGTVAHGYAYANFTEDDPSYFCLMSCTAMAAPDVSAMDGTSPAARINLLKLRTTGALAKDFGTGSQWTLWTFHVGQGMCSLLSDGKQHGILLDAGAGTPVVRPRYIRSAPAMQNDLRDRLGALTSVDLVLSHADRDHWCLISWDKGLRDKIQHIYVPDGAKSIALKDKAIIGKVVEVCGVAYHLKGGGVLEVLRSEPAEKSDNTDCLVSLYKCATGQNLVLQSGDYVYEDMKRDRNSAISSLDRNSYTAIVVPHHGDKASARGVFRARVADHSIAFFSAGDHGGYGHPTDVSKNAHKEVKYREISDQTVRYVKEIQLAP